MKIKDDLQAIYQLTWDERFQDAVRALDEWKIYEIGNEEEKGKGGRPRLWNNGLLLILWAQVQACLEEGYSINRACRSLHEKGFPRIVEHDEKRGFVQIEPSGRDISPERLRRLYYEAEKLIAESDRARRQAELFKRSLMEMGKPIRS